MFGFRDFSVHEFTNFKLIYFLFLQSGAAKYTVGSMLVFFLFLVSSASAADMCPGEPRCTCKWSGGKNTVDCSNAGKKSIFISAFNKNFPRLRVNLTLS